MDPEKIKVEHIYDSKPPSELPSDSSSIDSLKELESIDPKIEARIRRKYDIRILPIVTVVYLLAFIDRSNMGNARSLGMTEDLNLTGNRFSICLTCFFITYVIFEVPSNILCKRFGPKIWLSLIAFCFGLMTMCLSTTQSYPGMIVVRTFMGSAEAGIMPAISYMLSTFYRRHELVTRVGIYASFASLAGGFGGLLAIGFSKIPAWGIIHTWRNIFFFEGIICMISATVCYIFLPASPETAKFLTEEEKRIGTLRIRLETLTNSQNKLKKLHFKLAIFNVKTWLNALGLFCSLLCMNSIALFMPSLLNSMGFESIYSQLMTVPPYACGTIVCITLAMLSDRFKIRGPILFGIAGPLILIAFAILRTVENTGVRYMAIFFATCGGFTGSPVFVAWNVDNNAGPMVRAVSSAFSISLGCLGGILATWTYLPSQAPHYEVGHTINLCAGIVVTLTAFINSMLFRWENKQRDAGKRDHVLDGLSQEEIEELGHTHPSFRFTP